MIHEAWYSIVKYVPDPIRNEFLNIGMILIEDNHATVRFITNFGRVKRIYPVADDEQLSGLQESISNWIHRITSENGKKPKEVIEQLSEYLIHQTQLSEPLRIEIQDEDYIPGKLDIIFDKLFIRLVKPPSFKRRRKVKEKEKVSTQLNKEFRQLGLLDQAIYTNHWVEGTTPHPVTYLYQNGRQVAMEAVDIHWSENDKDRSQLVDATYGKWVDIRNKCKNEVERITLIHELKTPKFTRYVNYLKSVSDELYIIPTDKDAIIEKVKKDLADKLPPELPDPSL